MDVEILIILKDNFFKFDWIIIVVAIINSFLYRKVRSNTNKIYDHFNQRGGLIPRSLLRNKLFQNVDEVIY